MDSTWSDAGNGIETESRLSGTIGTPYQFIPAA